MHKQKAILGKTLIPVWYMPNDNSHDTRTTVPANRLAQAVALAALYQEPIGGSVPGVPEFTTSVTSSSITGNVTNANGATSYECSLDGTDWTPGRTVSGLSASTGYTYYLRGVNANGTGTAGTASVTTSAAPSGSLSAGDTVRVTDASIVAVANPLPAAMDLMQYPSLNAGDLVPDSSGGGLWGATSDTYDDPYEVDSSISLPWRARSIRSTGKKAVLKDPSLYSGGPGWSVNSLYHRHWIRFEEGTLVQPGQPGSHKILRCRDDPDDAHIRTALMATEAAYLYTDHQKDPATQFSAYPSRDPWENEPQQWHLIEYYQSISGAGPVKVWYDGKLAMSTTGCVRSINDSGYGFSTSLIGYDINISNYVNDTNLHNMSDYVAYPTFARVEISNESTWDDSVKQKRHPVQVSVRSNGEAELVYEPFDLDEGQQLYWWFFNADETVDIVPLNLGSNTVVI